LLVALSFLYYRQGQNAARSSKAALILTAFVAAAPVQDYVKNLSKLEWIRRLKVVCLWLAFISTVLWVVRSILKLVSRTFRLNAS
jgi:hypothetical protein